MDNPFDPTTKEIFKKVMGKDLPKTDKEDDNKIYISFLETKEYILEEIRVADDAGFADGASDGTLVKFVKYFKATGEVEEVNSQEYQGKVYYPIVDDAVRKNGIHLSTGIQEYKNLAEITDQIREFLWLKIIWKIRYRRRTKPTKAIICGRATKNSYTEVV